MMTMTVENLLALVVLAAMLAVAVYSEIKSHRIPNWLTLSGMAVGLCLGYLQGMPAFWSSLGGLMIGFGFLFLFYVFGGVGGGDVKLMGAAGALMGAKLIQPALFYTALVGVCLAFMIVIWRRDLWLRIGNGMRRLAFWRKTTVCGPVNVEPVLVPYGLAIAIGCEMAMFLCGAK